MENTTTHKIPGVLGARIENEVLDKEVVNIVTENTDSEKEKEVAEVVYSTGFRIAAIMIGLGFAVFCVSIDNTIITTAIPRITNDFKLSQMSAGMVQLICSPSVLSTSSSAVSTSVSVSKGPS